MCAQIHLSLNVYHRYIPPRCAIIIGYYYCRKANNSIESMTLLVNRWRGCREVHNFHKLWCCQKDFSGFSSDTSLQYWNQEQCCKTMKRSWLIVIGSVNCSYMNIIVCWKLPVQERRTWGHRKHLHLDLVFKLKYSLKKVIWYL